VRGKLTVSVLAVSGDASSQSTETWDEFTIE